MRNYRLHHRFFVGTRELRGENGENRYTASRKCTRLKICIITNEIRFLGD